jgi:hypothetical protein
VVEVEEEAGVQRPVQSEHIHRLMVEAEPLEQPGVVLEGTELLRQRLFRGWLFLGIHRTR